MSPYSVIAINLLLTVVIEGGVIFLVRRNMQSVYYSLLCNLLTNPALNLLLLIYANTVGLRGYYVAMGALEIAAVLVEAAVYRQLLEYSRGRALVLSLLLNAASFGLGLALAPLLYR